MNVMSPLFPLPQRLWDPETVHVARRRFRTRLCSWRSPWLLGALCLVLFVGAAVPAAEPDQLPQLAPGVMTTVEAEPEEAETVSGPLELQEILRGIKGWQPNFAAPSETLESLAGSATLRRSVWQIEFSYKPMRLIKYTAVDSQGKPQERATWYLIYRIRNVGRHLLPKAATDEFGHDQYSFQAVNHTVRFFPLFVLRDHEWGRAYRDQILPSAVARIHAQEIRDPKIRLRDSVEMSESPLEISTQATDRGLWGVATWDGVDPRTDFFSVYVQGLSNAYRIETAKDGKDAPELTYKTLQLNFWRPGDTEHLHVNEFRLGLPATEDQASPEMLKRYSMPSPAPFRWVYLP